MGKVTSNLGRLASLGRVANLEITRYMIGCFVKAYLSLILGMLPYGCSNFILWIVVRVI